MEDEVITSSALYFSVLSFCSIKNGLLFFFFLYNSISRSLLSSFSQDVYLFLNSVHVLLD